MGSPSYRHNPLHGLQLEGIFIGVQHLFEVIMPSGRSEGQIRNGGEGHESPVSRQDSGQVQSKEGPESGDTGGEWKWVSSRLGVQERLVGQPLL